MWSCSIIGDNIFDPLSNVIMARPFLQKGTLMPFQVISKLLGDSLKQREYPFPTSFHPVHPLMTLPESFSTVLVANLFLTQH